MTTLWSGRFDTAPDAAALEWGSSFSFDDRLFEDDVAGSLAWAKALSRAGVLSDDEARAIEPGAPRDSRARARRAGIRERRRRRRSQLCRTAARGAAGGYRQAAHTGRSRNEQVSLDLRLYLRRRLPLLQKGVARVAGALTRQARAAGDAMMPAYTHFRPAQPVLVAHFFLAHVAPLRRDYLSRLAENQSSCAATSTVSSSSPMPSAPAAA